jgi:3-oxoacyl-[acyl-carrier-protein] synthase II
MSRAVVITGLGAVTPLGVGADVLIDRWIAGECGLEGGVGECRDFDPQETMSVKEIRRVSRFAHLGFAATTEAIQQAGWMEGLPAEPYRVGCITGVGLGGGPTHEAQQDVLREHGESRVSPLLVPSVTPMAVNAAITQRYGLQGYSTAVCSACASGADAVALGTTLIETGKLDAVVVGGAEAAGSPLVTAAFARLDATSKCGISRPFDKRRDGFVLSEGSGVLVLEGAEIAATRGAAVLGTIRGVGMTVDAHHITMPHPTGERAAHAMRDALARAAVDPSEIAYVNAHGTSTPLNDPIETQILKDVLGGAAYDVPISSTKSVVGHTFGGAGAVDAVATTLALNRGIAPPTVGLSEPDPECDLDYVPERSRPLRRDGSAPLVGVSNSFGFGGHNIVLVIEAGVVSSR